MKRSLFLVLIVAVLFCGIPLGSAEDIAADLDPMISPDAGPVVRVEAPVSNVVSSEDATGMEKKVEKKKKEENKSKKSVKAPTKKSSEKKSSKAQPKKSKKSKKSKKTSR